MMCNYLVYMTKIKYVNIDTRTLPIFAEYYVELPDIIRNVKGLSIISIELPVLNYTPLLINCDKAKSNLPNDDSFPLKFVNEINNHNITNKKTINNNNNNNNNDNDNDNNEQNKQICITNYSRYVYLEMIEYEFNKQNNYLFSSSMLCSQISKYIIARIVIDYKNFPVGSILIANLLNGLLISSNRTYRKPIKLENIRIRLINEFGVPIFLEGLDFSFCIQLECEDSA